jgi:prenyltransferase beta subunit
VSSKTQSCTQGIWLWGEPIYIQERNLYIILVDCEGFGSLDQEENHDARIFCLSVLISSLIIFNSMEVIDEKNIESLSLAS